MIVKIKRVYEKPAPTDGHRVLIDRLWPRGISKENAQIDIWAKDISPSTKLRNWYKHDPTKWSGFMLKYFAELDKNSSNLKKLLDSIDSKTITLVFSSKEERLNNATALKEYIDTKI